MIYLLLYDWCSNVLHDFSQNVALCRDREQKWFEMLKTWDQIMTTEWVFLTELCSLSLQYYTHIKILLFTTCYMHVCNTCFSNSLFAVGLGVPTLHLTYYSPPSYNKVKMRCRKGIPHSLRAAAWRALCGGANLQHQNKGLFDVTTF